MSGTWGADPEQLDRLAAHLGDCASVLAQHRLTLNAHLYSCPWHGHEADRFRQEWASRLAPALAAAVSALHNAQVILRQNADQQRQASGVASVPGPVQVPGTLMTGGPPPAQNGVSSWSVPTFGITGTSAVTALGFLTGKGALGSLIGTTVDEFDTAGAMSNHDTVGTVEGALHLTADALKRGGPKNPALYLIGVNIDIWTDVGDAASNIDWSWAAMNNTFDFAVTHPGAIVDAVKDAVTSMPGKLISAFF